MITRKCANKGWRICVINILQAPQFINFDTFMVRHTQVSGVAIIEDVQVKIVLGAGARWPSCSSHSCACTYTGNPSSTSVYCRLALR